MTATVVEVPYSFLVLGIAALRRGGRVLVGSPRVREDNPPSLLLLRRGSAHVIFLGRKTRRRILMWTRDIGVIGHGAIKALMVYANILRVDK